MTARRTNNLSFCGSVLLHQKGKYLRQVENALDGAAAISVYTVGCTVWGLSYESCFSYYLLDSVSSNCMCQHLCFAEADKYCDCVSAGLNLLPCNDREILSISVCFYVWFVYWPSKTLKTDYKSVCMEHKF